MITPYGAWTSPISPEQLAGGQLSFFELSGYDGGVIWSEFRPAESGRVAIMRHRNGTTEELGHGFNARTLVHEYGGASAATDGHVVIATRYEDQRMYGIDGAEPIPITPEPPTPRGWRYADAVIAGDWVVAVREDHTGPGEPQNCLVAFPLDGESDPVVVASGNDFYSSPRISPDGATVAWIAWDHPNMPWDATHLWVADWRAPEARNSRMIPGEADESFFQPTWTPDNHLLVSADRTGWWNVYRVDGDALIAVASGERECGLPGWQFGMASFAVTDDVRLVTAVADEGMWSIEIDGVPVDLGNRQAFGGNITVGAGRIWAVVGGPTNPMSLIAIDLESGGFDVIRESSDMRLADGYVSRPEPIAFPTSDGDTAHAFFYPPVNADHTPPDGELPPLIVFSHGGPTSQTQPAFNLGVQFWTTRGFAVADVNYRGSTGYGRAYRDALRGRWGDVDVVDCVETARYLAATGRVDGDRLAIRGGSAGGYVTLCALTFHDVFKAGTSYCGVADIKALMETTHKFESRYDHNLIGPLPEADDLYYERSPIHHAAGVSCPLLVIQGSEDPIVTPDQAEVFVDALKQNGLPHAYLLIEGEDHFLAKSDTVVTTRNAELSFYGQLFGFDPAGELPRLKIENLP